MSHPTPAAKSPKGQKHETPTAPAAGPRGITRMPPHYSIEFVDGTADGEGPLQLMPRLDPERGGQESAPVLSHERSPSAPNRTGLPDNLKAGIESLSGFDMSHVRVHYNSSKPAQLHALAYTQCSDIHIAPGQEQHLPHEAWHVVQQQQGRVQPIMQMKDGLQINGDERLEQEANEMGMEAMQSNRERHRSRADPDSPTLAEQPNLARPHSTIIQRVVTFPEYVVEDPDAMMQLRDAYLKDIKVGGTWGAEIEARHLAEAYDLHVVFWAENKEKFQQIQEYGAGSRTLHILNHGNHFEALRNAPLAGALFSRQDVVENEGGGDCLYRAFFQAYHRTNLEPSEQILALYRYQVAHRMRQEPDLDLEGILTQLLDEFEESGFALGAGPTLHDQLRILYQRYVKATHTHRVGGGAIPPEGRTVKPHLSTGDRDYVPRNELSRADRMIDRIGRLLSTSTAVHVAVALDGNALVMSPNRDTPNVQAAVQKMVRFYGQNDPTAPEDPLHDTVEEEKRVRSSVKINNSNLKEKYRRAVDIEKMKALKSGKIERLTAGGTKEKIEKIKAALTAGLLEDDLGGPTAKEKYERGDIGIYFIPHVEDGTSKTVHGEMNVTEAIQGRRSGKNLTDNVYIGGTLIDCRDCNIAHGSRNEKLKKSDERWRFYSGGTHGNSFPNWHLNNSMITKLDQEHFRSKRFPGGSEPDEQQFQSPYWDRTRKRHGKLQHGYDYQYHQHYFWHRGRKINTSNTHSPRGIPNPYDVLLGTDWQDVPKTRPVLEDLFLRGPKMYIEKTHSSFAEDSDSDEEDYDLNIASKEKDISTHQQDWINSYRKSFLTSEFAINPSKALVPTRPTLDPVPVPKGLFTSFTPPKKLSFPSPPTNGTLVPYSGKQARSQMPTFDIYPDVLKRMSGMGKSTAADWTKTFMQPPQGDKRPFMMESSNGSLQEHIGQRPQLPAPHQEVKEANQLVRIRLGSPEYLVKIRRVLDNMFIQPQSQNQRISRQEQLQDGGNGNDLQIGPQQGPHGIPMSFIFDQFTLLLNLAGNVNITFTGSLEHCLQQVMVAMQTNTQEGIVGHDHICRIESIYRALTTLFHLTGLGQWSLSHLLDFIDASDK